MTSAQRKRFAKIISQFPKARVLVIGDLMLDQFLWGSVDRISPEAPVPVVNVSRESFMPGGALNVANNVHDLSGIVYPCGVVGRDAPGRLLLRTMRSEGINTGGIVYDPERPTAVKTRVIAHSQQVVRYDREKTDEISREGRERMLDFIQDRIRTVDVVVIEDYGKGVINPAILKKIVSIAKKYKKPILVDPKEKHFSYYKGVTVITPNRKEAIGGYLKGAADTEDPDLEKVGRGLIKRLQCKSVLLTLGEDGMMLFEKNTPTVHIPTAAREVYDVSGAGDTVVAVFSLALAAGAKLKEAALLSTLAASIVVGKLGTATIKPKELLDAVKKYSPKKSSSKSGRRS